MQQFQRLNSEQTTFRCNPSQKPKNINPSHYISQNKKIKFLDCPIQENQSDVDFKKYMEERLKIFQKNISDSLNPYNIIHHDSRNNQINKQNFQQQTLFFPGLCFFESISNLKQLEEEQKKLPYDEIKLNDQLIMILRYHTIEIYDQHGQKIETKKSFPFVNQPVSKDIKYNQIIGQKDEQLLKQSGNFVTSNIVDSYANYLYFSLKADDRKMYKRTFIFCSDFITNCTIKKEKNEVKWLTLFYEQIISILAYLQKYNFCGKSQFTLVFV